MISQIGKILSGKLDTDTIKSIIAHELKIRYQKVADDNFVEFDVSPIEIELLKKSTTSVLQMDIIFGHNDLVRYSQLPDGAMKQTVSCAGILIPKRCLKEINSELYVVKTSTMNMSSPFNVCAEDIFFNQQYINDALATCFVLDSKSILIPHHVLSIVGGDEYGPLVLKSDYYAVFGYTNIENNLAVIPKYNVIELASLRLVNKGTDCLIYNLNNPLPPNIIVPEIFTDDLENQMNIYAAGYPVRMPLTIAANGLIESINNTYFTTHLDLFQGNSGSPVFLTKSNKLIGFLSGDVFAEVHDRIDICDRGCSITHVATPTFLNSKKIIKISSIF